MTKISVVTISLNQGRFLERAIRSVISQEDAPFEYIVVDPGSTDGSREIIEQHRRHLDVIIYEKDAGPADGLNKGFSKASGNIFAYLNADDEFLPGSFAQALEFFRRHPDVDVVCGHANIVDEHGRFIRRSFSDTPNLRRVAYGASVQMQPSTFIRADAFRSCGGFNVQNRSNWDGELLVDLMLAGKKVAIAEQFWSLYRVHGESITGSGRLSAAHSKYQKTMFRKIVGREFGLWDAVAKIIFRVEKYTLRPQSLVERVARGPIFLAKRG